MIDNIEKGRIFHESDKICFIYILYKNEKICYVGRTKSISRRIGVHKNIKNFDSYSFTPCLISEARLLESEMIKKHRPIYNIKMVSPSEPISDHLSGSIENLVNYMNQNKLSPEDLGARLGVTGQSVRNWAGKKRHPKPQYITAIESITNGAVKPVDWFK